MSKTTAPTAKLNNNATLVTTNTAPSFMGGDGIVTTDLVPSSRNTSDNLYKQRFTNISPAKRLCQGLIEEFNKSKDTLIQNFS